MKYITDIHALNLPCLLGTTGDWHASALQWNSPRMLESDCSPFGDWGIEIDREVPPLGHGKFAVANHIRALLDMIVLGRFTVAQGMNGVFLDTDEYDDVIFDKVFVLSALPTWNNIDHFMTREYKMKWVRYKQARAQQ